MSVKVTITGIEHVTATLSKMGQLVATDMHDGFDQVGRMMQRVARAEQPDAPLSNWGKWFAVTGRRVNVTRGTTSASRRDLSFNRGRAMSRLELFVKIKKMGPQRIELGAYVGDRDAASSIYEKAGKNSVGKAGPGATFKANLNRKRGTMYPRVLSPAQRKADSWGLPYLERVLERSVQRVQSMMDRG